VEKNSKSLSSPLTSLYDVSKVGYTEGGEIHATTTPPTADAPIPQTETISELPIPPKPDEPTIFGQPKTIPAIEDNDSVVRFGVNN